MIFNYESEDFGYLRKTLNEFFTSQDIHSNAPENSQELKKLFVEILDIKNAAQLSKLDHKSLLYNSWEDINKARNGNYLSQDNALLYEIHKNGALLQNQIPKIYISLFLVLYADFYEASLILANEQDKNYFKEMSNKLLYLSESLSDANLRKLNFLWMEIPRNIFDKHLGEHLDKNVLETVSLLRSNQEFIEEKILVSTSLKEDISKIVDLLEEQKREYNFVGLSDGFNNLKEQKQKELCTQNWIHYLLMLIILLLIGIKSYWSINYLEDENFDNMVLIVTTVSTILLIFIILYFFRISLVNIKSIKSQILQIDLRLTLCQFIHNYENETSKLRNENMKASFDKFESVIFAPLVATEDQMPATFDGLEQLTGLLSSFNKGSK